jgi:hypothetical protein
VSASRRPVTGTTFPEHYYTTVQTQFLVSDRLCLKNSGDVIDSNTLNVIPVGQLHGPFVAEEEAITFKFFESKDVCIIADWATFIYKENGEMIDAGRLVL